MKENIKKLWLACLLMVWTNCVMAADYYWGVVTSLGKGVAQVVVTDGIDCVLTDAEGCYQIQKKRGVQYLYLSLPAGYLAPVEQSVPVYYKKTLPSVERYDFDLLKNQKTDEKHVFVVQADVQVTSEENIQEYAKFLKDMRSYLSSYQKKYDVFGIDCGDIVGDIAFFISFLCKGYFYCGYPFLPSDW